MLYEAAVRHQLAAQESQARSDTHVAGTTCGGYGTSTLNSWLRPTTNPRRNFRQICRVCTPG